MGIHVPTLLEGILEATAAEAAAKARITVLRAELEAEGRRRLAAEGAAPSWTTPKLGKVRLDPPGEWTATVADPAAFGSYVAEHHPSEATAVLRIPAGALELALEALGFAGLSTDQVATTVEVRPAWVDGYLKGLAVDVEETTGEDGTVDRVITVADTDTGALVDGVTATRSPAKLVVSLDRDRRQGAIEEAKNSAAALVEDAGTEDGDTPDGEAIRALRIDLEGMTAEQLAGLARANGLGSSGTKAALAERLARLLADKGLTVAAAIPAPREVPAVSVTGERFPYVGQGADGCRRSAEIDRTEADGLDLDDSRRTELLDSAIRWEAQAEALDRAALEPTPTEQAARNLRRAVDLDGLTAEVLKRFAKGKGIATGGRKVDVIDRLVEAGYGVLDVNAFAQGLA